MKKWRCAMCGYVYDSRIGDTESGIYPVVHFEELPDHWGCPDCGVQKNCFEAFEDHEN